MLKNKCKITVITVVFNGVQSIEKTILSVINQTYFNNMEYIIIDGGSTDGTLDIIKKYEKYLSYWVTEPDKGIYYAMNKGGKKASGDFIYFLNSGDTFYNDEIISKVSSKLNTNIKLLFGNILIIYDNYNVLKKSSIYDLKYGKSIAHQSAFVENTCFNNNLFNENYRLASDFDFFCTIIKKLNKNNIKKINLIITNFPHGGLGSNKSILYREKYKIIKKYFGIKYAYFFYMRRIFFEQSFKKILILLHLNFLLKFFTKINNKLQK